MKTGSLSQYAAHANVSPAYVTKLKAQGRVVMLRDANGRDVVNFDMTDRLVRNTADQARARNGQNLKGGATAPDVPAGASLGAVGGLGGVDAVFRRAQTQQKIFDAKRAEVEYKKVVGELVEKAGVERAVYDTFRALRDHAFGATQRAASRVVGMADAREVETLLAEELRRAFDGWEAKMAERLAITAPSRPASEAA